MSQLRGAESLRLTHLPFSGFFHYGFSTSIFGTPRLSLTGRHIFFVCAVDWQRRTIMNSEESISSKKLQAKSLSRRSLIRRAAGTAAGTGLLLGSGLQFSAFAEDEGTGNKCKPVP